MRVPPPLKLGEGPGEGACAERNLPIRIWNLFPYGRLAADERCLTRVERLSGRDIVSLRDREGVSQKVFARYLNVPVTLISQWERGERKPSGAAVKLLSIVKHKGLDAIA